MKKEYKKLKYYIIDDCTDAGGSINCVKLPATSREEALRIFKLCWFNIFNERDRLSRTNYLLGVGHESKQGTVDIDIIIAGVELKEKDNDN